MKLLILILFIVNAKYNCDHEDIICEGSFVSKCVCNILPEYEPEWQCRHKLFYEYSGLSMLQYILLIPTIGISTVTGMGSELQKISISMALLGYTHYEATIFTYYATAGSCMIYLLYLYCTKELQEIDLDLITIFFPMIIIGTDIGNFFNRSIPDPIIVIICIVIEITFLLLLYMRYRKQIRKEHVHQEEKILQQRNLQEFEDIARIAGLYESENIGESQELGKTISVSLDGSNSKFKSQLRLILFGQLILQLCLFFRGGSRIQVLSFHYSGASYWMITIGLYTLSLLFTVFINYLLSKIYQRKKQEEHPLYFLMRSHKPQTSLLAILIGFVGCLLTGLMGMGAGLFMVPAFILIKQFKMSPKRTAITMTLCQLLIQASTIQQSIINLSVNKFDSLFYFCIGVCSLVVSIPAQRFLNRRIHYNSSLISLIIIIFIVDSLLGILYLAFNYDISYTVPRIRDCKFNQ